MMLDPFFDFPDNVLYSKNISEGEHFLHAPSFGNRPAEELVSLKSNFFYGLNGRAQPMGRIRGNEALYIIVAGEAIYNLSSCSVIRMQRVGRISQTEHREGINFLMSSLTDLGMNLLILCNLCKDSFAV